jgi:hypothetical protein
MYKQMMGDYQTGAPSQVYDIKPNEKFIADNASISETLIIGVDKYGTDIFSLTVGKLEGLKTSIKKVFYGDEAEALYKTLINK